MAQDVSETQVKKYTGDELERALKDATRHKDQAAEYQGMHGQAVKQFCDRYHVNRRAFSLTRQMREMEVQKRLEMMRELVRMWHLQGFFAQADAFDDMVHELEAILADLKKAGHNSAGAQELAGLAE